METTVPWTHRKIFSLRIFELIGIAILYFFFAYSYRVTLWINSGGMDRTLIELLDPYRFWDTGGLEYLVMLFVTIPVWYLIFRIIRHWHLALRLSVHLVTLPLFLIVFQRLFYAISDYFEMWHLTGTGSIWDIYIPGLFYFVQFGMFHAYEYYRNNQQNMKIKAELSKAAIKSELAAIKAQLNPHFLYNTFNSINASLPPEQEDTREMIAKLSDLFRYQLKGTKKELVLLHEEINFLSTYLKLEKDRFGDRLDYHFDIPKKTSEAMIPPMILQPLVENAIRHGIAPKVEGGSVTIAAEISDSADSNRHLRIKVIDDGIGFSKNHNAEGVGLQNTILRLDKMFNEKLMIDSNYNHGTTISFKIPLHEESTHS